MKNYHSALRSNIWKIDVLFAIRGSIVHVGILVLYFLESGLTLREVFILEACYSLSQVLLEIPSGYASDLWGRKYTTILATFFKFFGMLILAFSTHFWAFLLAAITLSAGSSFYSGTLDALTYDSLLELQEEKHYRRINGQQAFLQFSFEAAASILGGLIALISLRATVWTTVLFFAIPPLIALTLKEPHRHIVQETRHTKTMVHIVKDTFLHNPPLRSIIILGSLLTVLPFALFWFTQPYQEMVGLPLALFGVIHAIVVAAHAIASKFADRLERWFDDRILLIFIALLIITGFIGLGLVSALWALIFFVIVRIAWGLALPITNDLINRMTTSDIRATVLSLRAFGFRLLFAISAPFMGYFTDVFSLNQAILITGMIAATAIVVVLLTMRRVWSDIPR